MSDAFLNYSELEATAESAAVARLDEPTEGAGPRARGRRWPLRLAGLILPVTALLFFELAVRVGWIPERLLPPPSQVFETMREMLGGPLWLHIGFSAGRVALGFLVGTTLGIAVASFTGLSRWAEALIEPTLQALRGIPPLAWAPLLLIWLGIDESPKIALIAIGAFFPVYLNLQSGIRNVDRKLIEVGEIHGLGRGQLIHRIFLPAALPSLFTGLRQGLSLSWMFVVAAELIAATKGLGFLLSDGRETSRMDIMLVAIFLLGIFGKLSDTGLRALERRLLAWRDVYESRESLAGGAL
ncbi:MAG: ABC transporter permease [Candidatus Korobacteraceae bacterium]|jgi:sulfonate transport system permease protein